ncbi:MAG: NAD(P)H-binding protein [Thermoplasmata archaeon]|nr:NAD(P)H-binding protein [Thermoplasmata archaeon]
MTAGVDPRPRLLLLGGGGGLVGRALLQEFAPDWTIRSLHRHPAAGEAGRSVEWVAGDAARVDDWRPVMEGVDVVVNLAWYRAGSDRRFRPLAEGLCRAIGAAEIAGVRRFVQISVPVATPHIETTLPYMVRKREVDRALMSSRLGYTIVRPTMLYGRGDKLLTVMLRTIARWHRLPMFGEGEYHVSPVAVRDLARIVRREAGREGPRTVDAGGPEVWRYRDLTNLLFEVSGRPPRYLHLTPTGGMRLARTLELFGSSLLYPYEVEWLVSDRLGLPAYQGLPTPLQPVREFLRGEALGVGAGRP